MYVFLICFFKEKLKKGNKKFYRIEKKEESSNHIAIAI